MKNLFYLLPLLLAPFVFMDDNVYNEDTKSYDFPEIEITVSKNWYVAWPNSTSFWKFLLHDFFENTLCLWSDYIASVCHLLYIIYFGL